jgi:hypothetical protein
MLFRRYSADLTPLLKYIVHQLYAGQTTEIVVLRELIWKMAGIEPLPSLSETQIAAMAGGPTLRIEAVASSARGARLDPGDAVLKGPQRLGKALLDSQLALPLLVQVAQQRQSAVYRIPDAHLKSLASLYDTVGRFHRAPFWMLALIRLSDPWRFAPVSGTTDLAGCHSTRRLCTESGADPRRTGREVRYLPAALYADYPPYIAFESISYCACCRGAGARCCRGGRKAAKGSTCGETRP